MGILVRAATASAGRHLLIVDFFATGASLGPGRAGPSRGPLAQNHCSAEGSAEKLGTAACVRYLVLHGTG